jgi:hypothetical protein
MSSRSAPPPSQATDLMARFARVEITPAILQTVARETSFVPMASADLALKHQQEWRVWLQSAAS